MPRHFAPRDPSSYARPAKASRRPNGMPPRAQAERLEPRVLMAVVRGMKFNDLDGDGGRDILTPLGPEPGLAGWTIYHDENENGALDAGEDRDVTDAEGNYDLTFVSGDGLNGGPTLEVVREVPQPGWRPTAPAGGDVTLSVRLLDVRDVDFGNTQLGLITGVKFNDADADGVQDAGERGVAGFTIFVDRDGDGVLDPTETRDVTAGDGSYALGVPVSRQPYTVRELAEPGWRQTAPGPQHDPGAHEVLVDAPAEVRSGFNFGNTQRVLITGQTVQDLDGDGTRDAGEPALPNQVVFIDADDDGNLDVGEASVSSGADGRYSFSPEGRGPFVVRQVVATGFRLSAPAGAAGGAYRVAFPLGFGGETAAGRDFLTTRRPLVRGVTYHDANADSTFDPGEPGIGGTTVYDDANNNNALDAGEARALTNADGEYELSPPAGGTTTAAAYTIREIVPDSFRQSAPRVEDGEYRLLLFPGQTVDGMDFGNTPVAPPPGPRVTGVFVDGPGLRTSLAGTAQAFRAAAGIDPRFGYPVPAGPNQLRSIPWAGGVSRVAIRFDADVAGQINESDLIVRGVAVPSYDTGDLFYDPATRTASWDLGTVVANDKLRLFLSDEALPGLDGGWLNASAAQSYPSGDGVRGGDFDFLIHVLAGDATQDGQVNAIDLSFIKQRLNRSAINPGIGGATYSVFADLTADGQINALDLAATKQRLNRRLPDGQPAATVMLL